MEPKHIVEQEKTYLLKEKKGAFLVGVHLVAGEKGDVEESLQELSLLCDTFGLPVLDTIIAGVKKIDAAHYIGEGKLAEIREICRKLAADVVVFDEEISPNQQRNLEAFLQIPVIDRTELIIEVFAARAKTKEAQLQIELAKIKYQFPRLKRMWTHLSRQSSGGGGHVKGEGEKQIEIDRRLLRKRMDTMKKEIEEVRKQRTTQRSLRKRSGIPTFALVGYTNAGKSTLMNVLTDAGVWAENTLFATLDTTTRKMLLPGHQEVLVVDTVGFIKKIPHTLVMAFKSTLEEAVYTDVLIHVIDASHAEAEQQAKATLQVLQELGAENRPLITLLNKADACEDRGRLFRLKCLFPGSVVVSALQKEGIDLLLEKMVDALHCLRVSLYLRIPQASYGLVGDLRKEGHIVSLDYEDNDILLSVEIPKELSSKYEVFRVS